MRGGNQTKGKCMATYVGLSEGEGGDGDVTIFCKHCREEILPTQAHRATNDPDCPGELMHLHDDPPRKLCWDKWHDERHRSIQSVTELGLRPVESGGR